MAENRMHAPGKVPADDNQRQRVNMAEGGKPMRGDVPDVSYYPGTKRMKGLNTGPTSGDMLPDKERGAPPSISMGSRSMTATAAPDHGPHDSPRDVFDVAPKGMRPHHVR